MRTLSQLLLLMATVVALSACDGDGDPSGPQPPFDLAFSGDASFNAPHGGQTIRVAVVSSTGGVVASDEGVVSATADPAFSFTFPDLLNASDSYQVHYWIDSNFGGGSAGACDAPQTDHQWSATVGTASGDVTVQESHTPAEVQDVCASFAGDLVFEGDATFQGAHGGQAISAAVVRSSDGTVIARQAATVSATADPSFSFTFPGALLFGDAFEVHYWIDSNFGGGSVGACDAPQTDHQWSADVGTATGDATVQESHTPAEVQDVCDSFAADLVFEGDASFQGAHGGQAISAAVVRSSDGTVIATQASTVSATADPSFSFSFPGTLALGEAYEVHYWIDSNFGGGSVGACDPTVNDHQWSVDVGTATGDVTVQESHVPAEVEDVCDSFAADLVFEGDVSFTGPHGGQAISAAVVRSSDGAVIATQVSTVSATADPAFSFTFPGALLYGDAFQVHYWIDSNFGGGTVGTCDPMSNDHQWNIDLGTIPADDDTVQHTEVHDPSAMSAVCSTFN